MRLYWQRPADRLDIPIPVNEGIQIGKGRPKICDLPSPSLLLMDKLGPRIPGQIALLMCFITPV